MAKLEFLRYFGDDPTEWSNKLSQFFDFQRITEIQKVTLASFSLEDEANQWWQLLHKAYKEKGRTMTWKIFQEKLWAHFRHTECKDFGETLSKM